MDHHENLENTVTETAAPAPCEKCHKGPSSYGMAWCEECRAAWPATHLELCAPCRERYWAARRWAPDDAETVTVEWCDACTEKNGHEYPVAALRRVTVLDCEACAPAFEAAKGVHGAKMRACAYHHRLVVAMVAEAAEQVARGDFFDGMSARQVAGILREAAGECSDTSGCECPGCCSARAFMRMRTDRPGRPPAWKSLCAEARRAAPPRRDGHRREWTDSPQKVLRAVRAAAAKAAADRGEAVDVEALTAEDLDRLDVLCGEVIKARENDAAEARRTRWGAFTKEFPALTAADRREAAMAAVEAVIPDEYLDAIPVEAFTAPAERAAAWAALTKPNDRGDTRIRVHSDYKAAMKAAADIADGEERTVFLGGPTTAGKTTLAALMLRRIVIQWQRNIDRGVLAGQRPTGEPEDGNSDPSSHDTTAAEGRAVRGARWADGDPVFSRLFPSDPTTAGRAPLVVWTTAREIFRLSTAPRAFPKPGEEAPDPLAHIREARILVIDEIGQEKDQKNAAGVAEIIYDRHDAGGLVTIVTSGWTDNLGPAPREDDHKDVFRFLEPLVKQYGLAFVRRVADPRACCALGIGFKREKDAPRGRGSRAPAPEAAAPAVVLPRRLSTRAMARATVAFTASPVIEDDSPAVGPGDILAGLHAALDSDSPPARGARY